MVTEQQSDCRWQQLETPARVAPSSAHPYRTHSQMISAGLQFLMFSRRGRGWASCCGNPDAATTACVLALLSEVPADHFNHGTQRQIEDSCAWVSATQTNDGGWSATPGGTSGEADATAWVVIALRQHGRPVPDSALEFIRHCQRSADAFAQRPEETSSAGAKPVTPEVAAIVARALGSIAPASSESLEHHLSKVLEQEPASELLACSHILDWKAGMASPSLIAVVRQVAESSRAESALEQALLLRCLIRLRSQKSWSVAATLGRLQHPDGYWTANASSSSNAGPGRESSVLATATALSALAAGKLQPGLYFGSDLPFRRLE